jgi:hypothetical protein
MAVSLKEKVLKRLEAHLDADEQCLHQIRAKAAWAVQAELRGATSGATALSGAVTSVNFGGTTAVNTKQNGLPTSGKMLFVLSNKRIWIFERSLLWGHIVRLSGFIGLDSIQKVSMSNEKGLGDCFRFRIHGQKKVLKVFGKRSDGTGDFHKLLLEQLRFF